MGYLSESALEQALLDMFSGLGYSVTGEEVIGPDGTAPERVSHRDVVLVKRLEDALRRLNPTLPPVALEDAKNQLIRTEYQNIFEENRRIHRLMVEGVDVQYPDPQKAGELRSRKAVVFDFECPKRNDWLATNQFTVIHGRKNRRPDVVVFVNGLPVAVIELKSPEKTVADLWSARNQLQTYVKQIPALFRHNELLVVSDGIEARLGSLTAPYERFMPWRTIDGKSVAPKGSPELPTLVEGVFERSRFLDLLRNFTVFGKTGSGLAKIVAGYHQFHAVKRAVECTLRASSPHGDRKVGVIWHTQGSGKSLLMAFYAGILVRHPQMANPTLVILTDRNDLDNQLFATFSMCADLIRQTPIQAESREDLCRILNRVAGGVVFTTLQKFGDLAEPITTRRNVVVIADEAHRSQYGFNARLNRESGDISYGFAKRMRDALPNASFIGFTGTPIESVDVNTPAVFGDYIDIYDVKRAVEDGATVPIYYQSRLARIELDEKQKPIIDEEVEDLVENESEEERERFKDKWSQIEVLVGSDNRIRQVAKDMVEHFENRLEALDGKAMAVCMSRRICVKLYDEICKLRPQWDSDDDSLGAVKVVMTGSAADPQEWQRHIGNQSRRELLARRMRDPQDPLKFVIVRDMWLTGFDVPCLHTMYVDKPMRGHGLMQAISRVNRVFRDKPAGLIVDYIGIAQNLKAALSQYSPEDRGSTGFDESEAVAVMMEKYEIVRDMFHGFDYKSALFGTPKERLATMARAIEWILGMQQDLASKEETEQGKKKAHRRYQDAVLALSKAYALASATQEALQIREEVGFFQAVRAALVKSSSGSGLSEREKEFAIRQIVSRAVISTEIVDILAASGLQSPDISILSDEFLDEIRTTDKPNLAQEALSKLIKDAIRSRSKKNLTQSRAFSERLEGAVLRYHANALTSAEVLQELIDLAREIREAMRRGEESDLSEEEQAFYDALAQNKSAVEVMGSKQLTLIAYEILQSLRSKIRVDCFKRESARAALRVEVKKVLKKYHYPPDLQDSAIQNVLRQAEAWSEQWVQENS